MPRDDYYKFLALKSSLSNSNYDIVSYKDSGYYFPFSKFINKNTTIWEKKMNPYIIGVFIDIFPLYNSKDSIAGIKYIGDKYLKLYSSAVRSMDKFPLYRLWDALKENQYRLFMGYIKSILLYSVGYERYMNRFESFECSINCRCGDKMVSYTSRKYGIEKEIFQSKWFKDYLVMPFADTDIRVPIGYDEFLKYVFGNYMQLPPVEQRVSDHRKYYANLKEGLTLKEVKQRIKEGEFCVY